MDRSFNRSYGSEDVRFTESDLVCHHCPVAEAGRKDSAFRYAKFTSKIIQYFLGEFYAVEAGAPITSFESRLTTGV